MQNNFILCILTVVAEEDLTPHQSPQTKVCYTKCHLVFHLLTSWEDVDYHPTSTIFQLICHLRDLGMLVELENKNMCVLYRITTLWDHAFLYTL